MSIRQFIKQYVLKLLDSILHKNNIMIYIFMVLTIIGIYLFLLLHNNYFNK